MKQWNWSLLLALSVLFVVLMWAYSWILYQNGLIPLGGKKAPSFIFLLLFQWYLVHRLDKSQVQASGNHFLQLFAYQLILLGLAGLFSAISLYLFYQNPMGLEILAAFKQESLAEIKQYAQQISKQEGERFFISLVEGIQGIDAGSIAKDDFFQKLALGFLPNLLISLYYKKS